MEQAVYRSNYFKRQVVPVGLSVDFRKGYSDVIVKAANGEKGVFPMQVANFSRGVSPDIDYAPRWSGVIDNGERALEEFVSRNG